MYHLVSHVVFQHGVDIYGPVHVLGAFLRKHRKPYQVFFLPLEFEGDYTIQANKKTNTFPAPRANMIFKFVRDIFEVGKYIQKYRPGAEDTVIAVDPLNCFLFAFAKPFSRFNLIYYTADYSDARFTNPVLNGTYLLLDKFAMIMCDQNWCVSERIVEKREDQGFGSKAVFLPNTPILTQKMTKQSAKHKNDIVYVGRMDDNMMIMTLLETISLIKKTVPRIRLTLLGGGCKEEAVKEYISKHKLQRNVTCTGPVSNDKVIKALTKSGIGVALYSGGNHWNRYGDSMKIREYQYFGIPVVVTDVPSNASEVQRLKSGKVLTKSVTPKSLMRAILEIQSSYAKFTENAFQNAVQFKKESLLEKYLHI